MVGVNRVMAASKSELPQNQPSTQPGALYTTKKLYKHPPIERCIPYGNMMFDRRIHRGSNVRKTTGQEARIAEAKNIARKLKSRKTYRIGTPPPVEHRRHERVQTELYLEELFEHPPERDMACQTDLFLDRPDSPYYVPEKTGLDVDTQIYPGELFDFDLEVIPVVQVIVGKTLEQSLIEVFEDDELFSMQAEQRRYNERRAAEKAELLRLEEQERRLREEKERRVQQFTEACRLQKEVEERIAAAVLTHGYLSDFLPNVLEGLRSAGYLLDNIKEDVERGAVPWLWNEINKQTGNKIESRDILTDIVRDITKARSMLYEVLGKEEDKIPKLYHTCHLLHDSSDDEDEYRLDDNQEWNIKNRGFEEVLVDNDHGGHKKSLIKINEEPGEGEGDPVEGEGVPVEGVENVTLTEAKPGISPNT